ncbi:hypothetical protein BC835DRAFT_1414146 [Cytidiella melzeri]|nr:hypothetical protein BC835DRAFT_1414146 [Cytidiella melzeri]
MSSDDEAPDAFSFSALKREAKGEARALVEFHAAEKQKAKERRRRRDVTLKERKALGRGEKNEVGVLEKEKVREKKKGKGKTMVVVGDEEEDGLRLKSELELRMERAMQEAEEEDEDEEDEDEDEEGGEEMQVVESDESQEDSDSESESSGSEEMDASDEDKRAPTTTSSSRRLPTKPDYLPDHSFAAAFSQQPAPTSELKLKGKSKQRNAPANTKKTHKRAKRRPAKDILVGGRTIRSLVAPTLHTPSALSLPKSLAPPAKTKQFLSRSLHLRRGDTTTTTTITTANSKLRGWERRSANIGVMKRRGPAAQFVRS